MRYVNTEIPGIVRDTSTGVLINKNTTELNQYYAEIHRSLSQEKINQKVEELSNDILEIKQLLKLMVSKHGDT